MSVALCCDEYRDGTGSQEEDNLIVWAQFWFGIDFYCDFDSGPQWLYYNSIIHIPTDIWPFSLSLSLSLPFSGRKLWSHSDEVSVSQSVSDHVSSLWRKWLCELSSHCCPSLLTGWISINVKFNPLSITCNSMRKIHQHSIAAFYH
jgi:hypothetical protein